MGTSRSGFGWIELSKVVLRVIRLCFFIGIIKKSLGKLVDFQCFSVYYKVIL